MARAPASPANPVGWQIRAFRLWACRATLVVLGWVGGLHAGEMGSPRYTLRHATLAGGGGVSVSTRFRLVSSLAAPGGMIRSDGVRMTVRQGFAGALNDPPQPRPDTARRPARQSLKIRVAALLANDRDPEADPIGLSAFDAVSVAGGRISLDNGWLLYEPPAAVATSDAFTYTIADAAGNSARALVTVLVAEAGPAPSLNLIAITLLPNGNKRLTFAGIARHRYAIEWTDSLPASHWELLTAVEADARGVIEWVDTTEPAPPQRFYRTVAE